MLIAFLVSTRRENLSDHTETIFVLMIAPSTLLTCKPGFLFIALEEIRSWSLLGLEGLDIDCKIRQRMIEILENENFSRQRKACSSQIPS